MMRPARKRCRHRFETRGAMVRPGQLWYHPLSGLNLIKSINITPEFDRCTYIQVTGFLSESGDEYSWVARVSTWHAGGWKLLSDVETSNQ